MPVVLVLTKFDILVSQVLLDIAGGDAQHHERARARAQRMCEDVFHKGSSDVPAGDVSSTVISHKLCRGLTDIANHLVVQSSSANPSFVDLIDHLIVTTDRFITNAPAGVAQSSVEEARRRVGVVPLAWSAALRVNHEIIVKTTIAYVILFFFYHFTVIVFFS